MSYRPLVTFPSGVQYVMASDVKTEADRQAVLVGVSDTTRNMLGKRAASIPPDRVREFSARVEFFRVAIG